MEIAILAGGKSSRFGSNKALADWFGRPLISHIVERSLNITEKVFIVANNKEPYAFLDLPVYPDIYPGRGPLSGLHSALYHISSNWVFLLGCDMPLIEPRLISHMVEQKGWASVTTVALNGRMEPLHSLYHRSLLFLLEPLLKAGSTMGLQQFIRSLPYVAIGEEIVLQFCPHLKCLQSANTPTALKALKRVALNHQRGLSGKAG